MLTLDALANPAYLCLAAKKARKYLLSRQWYHDRGSQEAFTGALTFRAWQLAQEILNGIYAPDEKIVFAAPKKILGVPGSEEFVCRPLAIQSFRDEVVQTAIVMLLSDHFESGWGDPESDFFPVLCSYGNRTFRSDVEGERLLSLGSSHLYRDWPEDYAKFVKSTSSSFNDQLKKCKTDECVVLFSSDISGFYPDINRGKLVEMIMRGVALDAPLLQLIKVVFGDMDVVGCPFTESEARKLASRGLLQGPVHSGFWSNVYLSSFDTWIKNELEKSLQARGVFVSISFYARYVDDFHICLTLKGCQSADLDSEALKRDISASIAERLKEIELSLSAEKTSIIVQNATGSLLTTGQVADRMAAITKKAYFPLPQEELLELEAEVRFLFGASRERVDSTSVISDSVNSPILDNPGVREQSRKRFAAGKWLRVARDLDRLLPGWLDKNREFASELIREWMVDPSQVQLLQRAFDIGLRPADINLFVKRLNSLRKTSGRPFFDFVWAYLLDQNVFQGKDWGLAYSRAVDDAIAASNHPVLVQRAVAWRLKNKRVVDRRESGLRGACRNEYWRSRQHLWRLAREKLQVTPYELGALLVSVRPSDRILKSLVSKALSILEGDDGRAQLVRSILHRRPQPMVELAEGWQLSVPELCAFSASENRPEESRQSLYKRILAGEFRNPVRWLWLAELLAHFLVDEKHKVAAKRGRVHPFSLSLDSETGLTLDENASTLTAYAVGAESRTQLQKDSSWAYPVGLILRAAATGAARDMLGATPISRFSMAGTFLWLTQRSARMGTQIADLMDRLAWWPGSRLVPIPDAETLVETVRLIRSNLAATPLADAVLSDIHLKRPVALVKGRSPHCVALCQLRAAPNKVSDSSVRRALSIVRTILRERQVEDDALNLVVFPEMSVPRGSIGTLCRFSRLTGCVVLAGLELIKDPSKKRHLNELLWIVPLDKRSGRVAVLRQEKIFPTRIELGLKPPVVAADPPVVWRLVSGPDRMAAINCYEFTYLPLRELLRGRVELMVVSANNQDVTTFDNLVESTHYDLYSHVVLINSERNGGSAIRAPYRSPRDRRIFDIHGSDLFSVNVCFVDLKDFRGKPSKDVKSRPAGFKVHG